MMEVTILKRNILQRLLGRPATEAPSDPGCWTYSDRQLVIDLKRAPELAEAGGAIRLEGKNLPDRILVIHADDDSYRAFRNRCKHMGRRLDPVPKTSTVQCCSISKTTYTYDGSVLYGPAKDPLETFQVISAEGKLTVMIGS